MVIFCVMFIAQKASEKDRNLCVSNKQVLQYNSSLHILTQSHTHIHTYTHPVLFAANYVNRKQQTMHANTNGAKYGDNRIRSTEPD